MREKKPNPRKQYTVLIGEKLKKCLDLQKEIIKESTYGIMDEVSYYNSGEILAEKILSRNDIL